MAATQAAVVGEHMAIQLLAELGAESTTADTAGQSAKNGSGEQANSRPCRASGGANCSDGLAA